MVLAPMSTRHPPEFRTTHGGRPASTTTCASAILARRSDSVTDRMTIGGAVTESAELVTLRAPVAGWPPERQSPRPDQGVRTGAPRVAVRRKKDRGAPPPAARMSEPPSVPESTDGGSTYCG